MRQLLLLFICLSPLSFATEQPPALQITPLQPGVFLHTSYRMIDGYGLVDSNGLIVVAQNQAVIIDTPWSEKDTQTLLDWISTQGFTLKASLSTHFHEDRTAGIKILNSKSIPTYASALTNQLLSQAGQATASHTFKGNEFQMLNGSIDVFYPGQAHTQDNLVVWLPQQQLLFGGCLIRGAQWDNLGFIGDANLDTWAGSVRNIQARYHNIKYVIPGHGAVGDASMLKHTLELANKTTADKPLTP